MTVKTNRKSNFCSSSTYPFLKQEGWYMIASENNYIVSLEHFIFESEEYQTKFTLRPHPKEGHYGVTVKLMSDCYYGLDT